MFSYLKNEQNNGFDNPIFSKCSLVKLLLLTVLYTIGLTLYITESSLYDTFEKLLEKTVTHGMVF